MSRKLLWVLLGLVGAGVWALRQRPAALVSVPGVHAAAMPAALEPAPPPAPEPVSVRELVPRARAGDRVRVELIEDRAALYDDAHRTEADAVYEALVEGLGRNDVVYDPRLGQAARELAYQQSVLGAIVPHDALEFLLESAGAIDKSVLQGLTRTQDGSQDPFEPVRRRVLELVGPPSNTRRRVGIGEAIEPGAQLGRTIAVLVSERALSIRPAPVRAQGGTRWELAGTLPKGSRDPHALVLHVDGTWEDIEATHSAGDPQHFSFGVQLPRVPGRAVVSLLATGPHGPGPLLQVPLYVDTEPPASYDTTIPPVERFATAQEAELEAFQLLNDDRARFGLPALLRDPGLDAVARAHSQDMRDNGWFGHWSDETGSPGDRLEAAGYRAAGHAENVASASTIQGAQEGLLESLGHRRNILTTALTHVGIGVVGKREAGRAGTKDGQKVQWLLTQLFARPAEHFSQKAAEEAVIEKLAQRRRALGLAALTRSESLDQLAASAALTAARGGNEAMAQDLIAAARQAGETGGGAYGATQVVAATTDITIPEAVEQPTMVRYGLAVLQLPDHPAGIVGVGLLLTGPKSGATSP